MKLSYNWVKEFVDIDLSVDELVVKIGAQLGAVEEVIDLGQKYRGIVVAKIVSCLKHPDADKLHICLIDDGEVTKDVDRNEQGFVQVVCGAPNAREGLLTTWLPPGVTVPSTYDKDPFVLECRELRGVVSNGMLASLKELGLGDEHDGIAELSFGEPGDNFAKLVGLDDHIIDIENKMFTHRPDCFGTLGLAREIAGITGQVFKSPPWYTQNPVMPHSESKLQIKVDNKIAQKVPRFAVQVIEGVEVKASPVWMQAYLTRVGIRPINNIVDVTNYVMYLTGQPLHAYDYDKLAALSTQPVSLETRMSVKGDKLKLLNGKGTTFADDKSILITSNNLPVGIAGVMGGLDTEVGPATKNIVLECANFDMYTIRRTSMQHGLFTDAVTRFNKGQSSLQNPAILLKSADWIQQLAGGKLATIVDDYQQPKTLLAVELTVEFINSRLGTVLDAENIIKLLINVEFEVSCQGQSLTVTPPFWRTDIEIAEDVVEEVGRLYGYDNLPLQLPVRDLTPASKNMVLETKKRIRECLVRAGANELLTYSFVHGDLLSKANQKCDDSYKLSNALSPDLQYYRQSLTPSLLDKIHPNIKSGHDNFALFEIGKTHNKIHGLDPENLPGELDMMALVYASKQAQDGSPYYRVRKYLDYLMACFGLELSYKPLESDPGFPVTSPFDWQRSALVSITQNDMFLGIIGEYRPEVIKRFKLPACVAGFEIDPSSILKSCQNSTTKYVQLSKFPNVQQDISFKVPIDLKWGELYDFVSSQIDNNKPKQTIATLTPLDIYQKDDTKHVAFRLKISSYLKTLTDAEVQNLLEGVATEASAKLAVTRI